VLENDPFSLILTDVHMPESDGFCLAEQIRNAPDLAWPLIMMLTSGEQRGDSAKCRELGISAYLTKPIRRAELSAAIVKVLATRSQSHAGVPGAKREEQPLIAGHGSSAGLRILLAEDNEVNRRVARRILEKEGHTVISAEDGRGALTALNSQIFDLVLMDVQMPELDGLGATRAIREREKQTSEHIPIIAMTAHAMGGDRERFLEAGMDDYISKPINARALLSLLGKHCPPLAASRPSLPG
jgi:two-component system sensor histidine kinase/response regulator